MSNNAQEIIENGPTERTEFEWVDTVLVPYDPASLARFRHLVQVDGLKPKDWSVVLPAEFMESRVSSERAAFRRIAELGDPTWPDTKREQSLCEFTNEFGQLADLEEVNAAAAVGVSIWGTTMEQWSRMFTPLYTAVQLWEWAEDGEESLIRDWTEPDPNRSGNVRRWPMHYTTQQWFNRGWPPGTEAILDLPDPVQRARRFAASIVNEGLRLAAVTPTFGPSDHPRLEYQPTTLDGAMWIQCAEWIEGTRTIDRCKQCGSWFDRGEAGIRFDATLCSDACKSRAYRQKKTRAVQLVAEGMTPAKVARELGSRTEKVKKWVKQDREKKRGSGRSTR